nr:hypothetical protein [Saprospiraceae bacterium]
MTPAAWEGPCQNVCSQKKTGNQGCTTFQTAKYISAPFLSANPQSVGEGYVSPSFINLKEI